MGGAQAEFSEIPGRKIGIFRGVFFEENGAPDGPEAR